MTVYPEGVTAPSLTISEDICNPSAIVIDDNYDVIVANRDSNSITSYAAGSDEISQLFQEDVESPAALALDDHQNVYILNSATVVVEGGGELELSFPVEENGLALAVSS